LADFEYLAMPSQHRNESVRRSSNLEDLGIDRGHARSVQLSDTMTTDVSHDLPAVSRQGSRAPITSLPNPKAVFEAAVKRGHLFEEVCEAVRNNDTEFYCLCLREKPELVNTKGMFGDTLMHWAILSGAETRYEAAKKLVVDFGADVCVTSKKEFADGHTALYLAASQVSSDVLKLILDKAKNANLNCRTLCGETPLHKASMAGKDMNVKRLLEMTADINAVDNFLNTALHHGAYAGNKLVVRKLMEAGAQRGLENRNKQRPEQIAKTPGVASLINELSPDREDGWNGSDDEDGF